MKGSGAAHLLNSTLTCAHFDTYLFFSLSEVAVEQVSGKHTHTLSLLLAGNEVWQCTFPLLFGHRKHAQARQAKKVKGGGNV